MSAQAFRILSLCAITRISNLVDSRANNALVEIRAMADAARGRVSRSHGQLG